MTYKCKICGGQGTVDNNNGVFVCDYCGTKQALPLFTEDSERLLYDRGNNYLLHSEYDKAENVFNQLLTIKPGAAELYWDLVLCKYGVTYVKDPKTCKYIPTCNRTHYTPIFSDENYKKAIELSSGEKKALFEEDAKTIDNIQKGIIAVSKKEKPFDIFISYKETDANGNRTKDSIEAQKLYEKLTEAGYKVFFSRITLESKIGSQYEPYIYAALSSSKVMLTVCSSEEYIQAPWVKNEWSRFLTLRQGDSSKTLIPLYFDMDSAVLPEEFANLSAQDMAKEGFEQELIRGIKKLIPLPVMLAAKRKQSRKKIIIASAVTACVLTVGGFISAPYIKDYIKFNGAYKSAMVLYNDGEYSKAAEAFESLSGFRNADEMRSKANNVILTQQYNAAMKLYNDGKFIEAAEAFGSLGDFNDSSEMITKCEAAQVNRDLTEKYNNAIQLYNDCKYAQSAWAFKEISDFNDSAQMQKHAELAWRQTLAVVSVYNTSEHYGDMGACYITANGDVELLPGHIGTNHENLMIDEHGKFISLAEGPFIKGLHEDGYVTNSAGWYGTESDLEDIVQINYHVALKNDGTVIGLEDAKSWKNIVALDYCDTLYGYGRGLDFLVGLDSDGNVHSLSYPSVLNDDVPETTHKYLSGLKNIAMISVGRRSVVAIDNDGTLYAYFDDDLLDDVMGVETVVQNSELLYADISYVIDKDNNLCSLENYLNGSDVIESSDIIHCGSQCGPVARDGKTGEVKTRIQDAWLVRKTFG